MGLNADSAIEDHFRELAALVDGLAILGELTPRATDAISAYGERLSSVIVAAFFNCCGLPTKHLDSRDYIVTDQRHTQAAPIFSKTNERLRKLAEPTKEVRVMGGFIASTEEGITSTLGRGGSDYTASIVGAGAGAEEIQIWTDVDGHVDDRSTVFSGGLRVKMCSFAEQRSLLTSAQKYCIPRPSYRQ